MIPKQAVTSLIYYLDEKVGPPVRTSMNEDEGTVPVVELEEWEKTNENYHNTISRGYLVDSNGDPVEEVFHKYYTLRVDLNVRTRGEEETYDVADLIETEVILLEEEPQLLHEHIREMRLGNTRGVTPHHTPEPSESSAMMNIEIDSFKRVTRDVDVLETIDSNTEVIN
jgi:hypothetical protein